MTTEYSIRLASDPDAPDYFATDDLSMAIRFRQEGVRNSSLPMDAQVFDDDGALYELYYLGSGSIVTRNGKFYAEWIDGKAVGEARP